jgi:hypothetical protein
MKRKPTEVEQAVQKLDKVVALLEDLFILQALHAGVNRDGIRRALRIGPARVSAINKGFKHRKGDKD